MEFENKKHPIVEIEGFAAAGKQFDLDITIPEDNRDVIYGVVRDCYKNPVCDAVVKLIEVEKGCREERKPVSHTFTDKHGEFVFGPLCPHTCYAIEIWANKVEHIKVCAKCNREGRCLKGIEVGPCNCFEKPERPCHKEDFCKKDWYEEKKDECKKECKPCCCKEEKEERPCHMDKYEDECKKEWFEEKKDECKKECKPCCCKEEKKENCKNPCRPCCR